MWSDKARQAAQVAERNKKELNPMKSSSLGVSPSLPKLPGVGHVGQLVKDQPQSFPHLKKLLSI